MKPLKKHINAVKKTIKMWEWLKDNPDKDKEDYFSEHNLSKHFTEFDCYLCYYWRFDNNCCYNFFYEATNCPLDNKIAKKCFANNSAFILWGHSKKPETKAKYAQIIVDLCKDWLKKYNTEEIT